MAQRIQGCEDLFGEDMRMWQHAQATAHALFDTYGFEMIETPALEQLATFVHGIGESSDVVRKEMFRVYSGALLETLFEKGSESHLKAKQRMALRPEGTAGVVRACVEHNFIQGGASDTRLWYAEAMFRGERPQKGRLRQFHQIGVEWLAATDPCADAECIMMLMKFYERMGFKLSDLVLRINSMGDASCRPAYRALVKAYIDAHADGMCEDCRVRSEINPLRAFDCKNETCQEIMSNAPLYHDHLCEACSSHYQKVKSYLDEAHISYVEDPTLVRGLDYYTRTVFEVECPKAQVGAIGGGGRYDGLVELEGGKPCSGLGWALGFERMLLALRTLDLVPVLTKKKCVYVAYTSENERMYAHKIVLRLREAGIYTESSYQTRSLKAQFKQADKYEACICVVIGDAEVASQETTVRDMHTHEQKRVDLCNVVDEVRRKLNE